MSPSLTQQGTSYNFVLCLSQNSNLEWFSGILLWIKYKNILLQEAVNLSSLADGSFCSTIVGEISEVQHPISL